VKEKVLLAGPIVSELWWEFERFAPYVFWKKKELEKVYGKITLVCLTRPDRFDIYGMNCDILVPLNIEGDGTTYKQDCFRLSNFPASAYIKLIEDFKSSYLDYEILDHVYPKIDDRQFCNKYQFPKDKKVYDLAPRKSNKEVLEKYLVKEKPIVTIAPRFRKGFPRNWPYWQRFYDMVISNSFFKKYQFVICGKSPDYVPDKQNRFLDVNTINLVRDCSLIGVTIELLKKSILTVGSQSGIPNISLLLGTPALQWGNQKYLHIVEYNVRKTPVTYLDDVNYKIEPQNVVLELQRILLEKEKKSGKS